MLQWNGNCESQLFTLTSSSAPSSSSNSFCRLSKAASSGQRRQRPCKDGANKARTNRILISDLIEFLLPPRPDSLEFLVTFRIVHCSQLGIISYAIKIIRFDLRQALLRQLFYFSFRNLIHAELGFKQIFSNKFPSNGKLRELFEFLANGLKIE